MPGILTQSACCKLAVERTTKFRTTACSKFHSRCGRSARAVHTVERGRGSRRQSCRYVRSVRQAQRQFTTEQARERICRRASVRRPVPLPLRQRNVGERIEVRRQPAVFLTAPTPQPLNISGERRKPPGLTVLHLGRSPSADTDAVHQAVPAEGQRAETPGPPECVVDRAAVLATHPRPPRAAARRSSAGRRCKAPAPVRRRTLAISEGSLRPGRIATGPAPALAEIRMGYVPTAR